MDHVAGFVLDDGHLQSVENAFRAQVVGHGTPDDLATECVEHDVEAEGAGTARNIADIRHIEPALSGGGKVSIDEVGSRMRLPIPPRRD